MSFTPPKSSSRPTVRDTGLDLAVDTLVQSHLNGYHVTDVYVDANPRAFSPFSRWEETASITVKLARHGYDAMMQPRIGPDGQYNW